LNAKSGKDWDDLLDSYENFINRYVRLMKKAQNGDLSAITEYTKYMQDAINLAEEVETERGDLTSAQLKRFLELQTQFSQETMNMY